MSGLETEAVDGTGTPIVFIHGWMGSLEIWDDVRGELELENPLIFYSQRCHGESKCSSFSIKDLAEDLEEITEDLEKPILVGHSMGGMTALTYSTISENFSGLILFATSARTPSPRYMSPVFTLHELRTLLHQKLAETNPKSRKRIEKPEIGKFNSLELLKAGIKPLIYGLKAMKNYDIREKLEEEKALVVAGKNDNVIPRKQSKEVARLLKCEYREIDATHVMIQEKPRETAEIIEDFVKKT